MEALAEFTVSSPQGDATAEDAFAALLPVIRARGLEHAAGPRNVTLIGPLDEVLSCLEACHNFLDAWDEQVRTEVSIDARPDRRPAPIRRAEPVKAMDADEILDR